MLFDKEMKRVNTFVDMDTELVKGNEIRTEGSSKRAGEELESKNLKKQKLDENVKAKVDDDQEEAEMKKHMEIVPDDEVAIDVIPLATKPPIIVDWKIIKEGKMGYFQIIRADGSSKRWTLRGNGGESFWEEGDDFGVDVLRFHTCLTDILGFLEKFGWWFEQDIGGESEDDREKRLVMVSEEGWMS
ncbi:hypothetical protein Tco_0199536 [Tanacetum coccineum]